ncbi:MAG: flagellar protein FlaG [Planctomycetes bacterium]|nr:flagellar protein FlaG [Planctomycetota bacterium]
MDPIRNQPADEARALREPARPGTLPGRDGTGALPRDPSVQLPLAGGPQAGARGENLRRDESQDQRRREEKVRRAAQALAQSVGILDTLLRIEIDTETEEPLFLVVHKESGRILRRIPTQDALPVLQELKDLAGFLLDEEM